MLGFPVKKDFKKIYVIQSYPTLMHLITFLAAEDDGVAVIVSLDGKIYRFLKNYFSGSEIKFFLIGRAEIFRRGYYIPIRLIHTIYLTWKVPKFRTDELILTYANWTDIGSIYLKKVKFKRLTQLVPDTEKRYQITTSGNQDLSIIHKYLNLFTGDYLEIKDYLAEINGEKIIHRGVGLKNLAIFSFPFERKQLNELKFTSTKYFGKYQIRSQFLLFIDKDIITPGFISFYGYYLLMKELKKTLYEKKVDIYIKFKPRHYSRVKHLLLVILGYKIAPTEAPAQIFSIQEKCLGIIGFTSSSMSLNYKKPIVSLSNLRGFYSKSMNLNAESMKQRSTGETKIFFPKDLREILNFI